MVYGSRSTDASTGSISAPGPGSPATALLISPEPVRGTQYVATNAPSGLAPNGAPVRTIAPPSPVGKHGNSEFVEQQSWEMPPLTSTQRPRGSTATHAAPVQRAVHVPPRQLSSCVCGPCVSGQGSGTRRARGALPHLRQIEPPHPAVAQHGTDRTRLGT
jgi:hypothetical protein